MNLPAQDFQHFMISYHNYRNCFPFMALGKFVSLFVAGKAVQ